MIYKDRTHNNNKAINMKRLLHKTTHIHKTTPYKHNQSFKSQINRQYYVRHDIRAQMSPDQMQIIDASSYIGRSLTLFTMFFCGMNWVYYKEINKKLDSEDEKDPKDKK